jgi:hypothetical protein
MSSGTSTDPQTLPAPAVPQSDSGLQPWQLFTLAGLVGATVVVFISKGESAAAVILLSLTIFAAAAVGLAALRTFVPLAGQAPATGADVPLRSSRTLVALEREKALVLRSIKEIEFDRAMGKMSERDFAEMSARLRQRAARLMRELDAGAGYREQIEREITRRVAGVASSGVAGSASRNPVYKTSDDTTPDTPVGWVPRSGPAEPSPGNICASCETANDSDARFCKGCGGRLGSGS